MATRCLTLIATLLLFAAASAFAQAPSTYVGSGGQASSVTLPGGATLTGSGGSATLSGANANPLFFQSAGGSVGIGSANTPEATLDIAGDLRTVPTTYASLPTCSSTVQGAMRFVTDSTTNVSGATITGSGSDPIVALCDGTNWIVGAGGTGSGGGGASTSTANTWTATQSFQPASGDSLDILNSSSVNVGKWDSSGNISFENTLTNLSGTMKIQSCSGCNMVIQPGSGANLTIDNPVVTAQIDVSHATEPVEWGLYDTYNGTLKPTTLTASRTYTLPDASGTVCVSGACAGGLNSVTFSATPTFDASLGSTQEITLTANVTSSTLSNATAGQQLNFIVCQDSSGSRTFTWPTNVLGGMTIGSTASECSAQSFIFDGTNAYAISPGVVNQ